MRARLEPGDVGLPAATRRRRTAGLRIEELASIAGVSLTWYSALEAGKGVRVSQKLLDRVADALRLNIEEREYLQALARPVRASAGAWTDEPVLQAVLDGFTAGPAFVTDRYWAIRAYNGLADDVYRMSGDGETNLLLRMFLDPYMRALHEQWERIAQEMVAILHLSFANPSDDPTAFGIVSRLREASDDFAHWWDGFTLRRMQTTSTTLAHPTLGRLSLTFARFVASPLEANEDRVVVVLQPPADEQTAQRLRAARL